MANSSKTTTVSRKRPQQILKFASQLYDDKKVDWVAFFKEVLGVDGVIRRSFSNDEDRLEFERTPEYVEIQKMLANLRERRDRTPKDKDPQRVITVRLPKSVHEVLRAEAESMGTSINKLCITKLLQTIDEELFPALSDALEEE